MTDQPTEPLDDDPDFDEDAPAEPVVEADEANDDPNYDPANDDRDGSEPPMGSEESGPFSGKES